MSYLGLHIAHSLPEGSSHCHLALFTAVQLGFCTSCLIKQRVKHVFWLEVSQFAEFELFFFSFINEWIFLLKDVKK